MVEKQANVIVTFASPICSLRNLSNGSITHPTAAWTYKCIMELEKLAHISMSTPTTYCVLNFKIVLTKQFQICAASQTYCKNNL